MKIQIKTDFLKTYKDLNDVAFKQVPFASALALTRLAQKAQDIIRADLPGQFTLRNTWVQKGITIQAANKKDWPYLSSAVGSRDWFMADQATGGQRRARDGRNKAIPLNIRSNKTELIKKKDRPKQLLNRKKSGAYLFTTRKGHKMIVRDLVGPTRNPNLTRVILYRFKPVVQIKKAWPFEERVTQYVQANYDKFMGSALAMAIAKGKK